MLALTDTLAPEQGGFEAVPGFHTEFTKYFAEKKKATSVDSTTPETATAEVAICKGDFCPIRVCLTSA